MERVVATVVMAKATAKEGGGGVVGRGVEARVEAAGARCLPQPRPLMREQVAERYAAAAGEEREQDPEEDDHPVRRQARHEQGRRRGRVL